MSKILKRAARKIWLVAHPLSQFAEDVKDLAVRNGLKIVDAKFSEHFPDNFLASKTPKLTSITAELAAAEAKAAEEAEIEAKVRAEAEEEAEIERKYRLEVDVRARVSKEMADEAAAKAKK